MKYRPEIDGLRAVAVVPVIFLHAGIGGMHGGFVGVDVFFVISGYLITGIILEELSRGTFSLAGFYERRARRILPALYLVLIASFFAFRPVMFPRQFTDFAQSLIATPLFLSNVLFWRETGYFMPDAELKPLLHTWSLAVEEQFYLVFPLMCLLLWRWRLHVLVSVTAVLAGASFVLTYPMQEHMPAANYYLIPTRAWELGVGAFCAYVTRAARSGASSLLGLLGLAMILAAVFLFDETVPYPSYYTLMPVLGTALVILFAQAGTLPGRALALQPMVWVGLVSYSAYLWHQPVLAYARLGFLDPPATGGMLLAIALTFALATLTRRLVEVPFLRRGAGALVGRRTVFAGALAGAVFIVGLAAYSLWGGGAPAGPVLDRINQILAYKTYKNNGPDGCYLTRDQFPADDMLATCAANPDRAADILLLGDSHSDVLYPDLSRDLAGRGHNLAFLGVEGCPPALGFERRNPHYRCDAKLSVLLDEVLASEIGTVVLHARWAYYGDHRPFENGLGGTDGEDGALVPVRERRVTGDIYAAYADFIHRLLADGKRVIVLGPVPEAGWDVPLRMAKMAQLGLTEEAPLSIPLGPVVERRKPAVETFGAISDGRFSVLDPLPIFCDAAKAVCYQESADREPYYRDPDHLSAAGAKLVATAITEAIDAADNAADGG